MTISFVAGTSVHSDGTGNSTLAVTTSHVGDVICLGIFEGSTSITVSSISGGGASWARAGSPFVTSAGGTGNLEIWYGTVTSVGSSTITVTYSGSVTSTTCEIDGCQFTNGNTATTWGVDTTGGLNNTTSATTIAYPSLTAASAGELYYGKGVIGTGTAGTTGTPATAGFFSDGFSDPYAYGLPTAAGAYQPVQNTSASTPSSTFGALLIASVPAPASPAPGRVVGQAVSRAAFF